jgi:hypothetical protein
MKEGYYQKKIAEFSEKLQDFNHRLNMAETEFERYQNDLGTFKDLLKKLKHVEEFQQEGVDYLNREARKRIDDQILSLKEYAGKEIDKQINLHSKTMTKALDQLQKDEQQFRSSLQELDSFRDSILYYKEFQRLFILKLINKGILNNRELSEIEQRSKKRVKNKEE